ncbi:MAG: T9SS type A sorting domain-containing protein [Bacteroidetes bacterium]|jgi:hypothetical protein|nr:T9SS type A sorting domain-containing protein [Bacteroidota bacterium]MBT6685980.1 T9SS type A sorting domain-containing protein [Bacteroidota bacterium]MBT7144420.1 T9SS type A sorting domain-containing protein [Bacteroidota bacterium]MBT7490861.1 T9SS type A sorting domain-containing protein [Bacteroidota bacterium]
MKRFVLIFALTIIFFKVFAYQFKIEGFVTDTFGNDINHHEVYIYSLSMADVEKVETNKSGYYSKVFNIPFGYFPKFYVQSWSNCNGDYYNQTETCTAYHGTINLDFEVCNQHIPQHVHIPNFQMEKINNLSYGFINTSFGFTDSVYWSFEFDTISTEFMPIINFPEKGLYDICLQIFDHNDFNGEICETLPIGEFESAVGTVKHNGINLQVGIIYLYQRCKPKTFTWISKYEIVNGEFEIPHIFYNHFYIQAIPQFDINFPYFPKYLPTYVGNSGIWQNADSITMQSPIPPFTIELNSYDEMFYGSGSISGTIIRHDSVDFSLVPIWLTYNHLPPVTVYLLNDNNEILDFRFLETSMDFEFLQIPLGNYRIKTDVFNYIPIIHQINLSEENKNYIVPDIRIYQDEILLNTETNLSNFYSFNIFPNPSKDFIRIESSVFLLSVKVFDLQSVEIFCAESINSRTYNLDINAYEFGIYIVELETYNNQKYRKKIVKIKN